MCIDSCDMVRTGVSSGHVLLLGQAVYKAKGMGIVGADGIHATFASRSCCGTWRSGVLSPKDSDTASWTCAPLCQSRLSCQLHMQCVQRPTEPKGAVCRGHRG